MTEFNPVFIESALAQTANEIADSVIACDEAYRAYLEADRAFDNAYAHAYLDASGAVNTKKYKAQRDTMELREARDIADAAWRYADRRAKALELQLRSWQSVGASVRSMYSVAGRVS